MKVCLSISAQPCKYIYVLISTVRYRKCHRIKLCKSFKSRIFYGKTCILWLKVSHATTQWQYLDKMMHCLEDGQGTLWKNTYCNVSFTAALFPNVCLIAVCTC